MELNCKLQNGEDGALIAEQLKRCESKMNKILLPSDFLNDLKAGFVHMNSDLTTIVEAEYQADLLLAKSIIDKQCEDIVFCLFQ